MQIKLTFLTAITCCTLLAVPALARSKADHNAASANDQDFFDLAGQSNMLQAHLGQMAETQSTQRGVRDLGLEIHQKNTSDYQNLTELAAKAGAMVPKAIDQGGNKTIDRLSKLRDATFDRAFIHEIVQSDKKLIDLYERKAKDAKSPEVKQYATNALPNLKLHMYEAQDWNKYGQAKK